MHILKTAQTSLKEMKPSIENRPLVGRKTLLLRASPLLSLCGKETSSHLGGCVVRNICVTSRQSPEFLLNPFSTVWGRRSPSASKQVKEASQELLEYQKKKKKNGSPGGSGTGTGVRTHHKGAPAVSWPQLPLRKNRDAL